MQKMGVRVVLSVQTQLSSSSHGKTVNAIPSVIWNKTSLTTGKFKFRFGKKQYSPSQAHTSSIFSQIPVSKMRAEPTSLGCDL